VQAVVFTAVTAVPYIAYTLFGYRQFCTGEAWDISNIVQVMWDT
jgi:hypothetical protein